eukprot:2419978-Prymnesium_polylepis.1
MGAHASALTEATSPNRPYSAACAHTRRLSGTAARRLAHIARVAGLSGAHPAPATAGGRLGGPA